MGQILRYANPTYYSLLQHDSLCITFHRLNISRKTRTELKEQSDVGP